MYSKKLYLIGLNLILRQREKAIQDNMRLSPEDFEDSSSLKWLLTESHDLENRQLAKPKLLHYLKELKQYTLSQFLLD